MLRTKKQIQNICNKCPLAKTANLIGDTFTLLIIRDLLSKPKRFNEVEKSLIGVSSRTIANKLKFLENKKLIKSSSTKDKPSHIEYHLMKNGKALYKILETMKNYGKKYL